MGTNQNPLTAAYSMVTMIQCNDIQLTSGLRVRMDWLPFIRAMPLIAGKIHSSPCCDGNHLRRPRGVRSTLCSTEVRIHYESWSGRLRGN